MTIDRATHADAAAILSLLAASGLPELGVTAHLGTAVVARENNHLVGCAALEVYDDGVLLRSVAVASQARGTGVGEQLVRAALALADEHKAPGVYLLTTTAEHFFPRFGFERVSRADVPAGVRMSAEFQGGCCASAVVMRRTHAAIPGTQAT